jgi:hypothetical protein
VADASFDKPANRAVHKAFRVKCPVRFFFKSGGGRPEYAGLITLTGIDVSIAGGSRRSDSNDGARATAPPPPSCFLPSTTLLNISCTVQMRDGGHLVIKFQYKANSAPTIQRLKKLPPFASKHKSSQVRLHSQPVAAVRGAQCE